VAAAAFRSTTDEPPKGCYRWFFRSVFLRDSLVALWWYDDPPSGGPEFFCPPLPSLFTDNTGCASGPLIFASDWSPIV